MVQAEKRLGEMGIQLPARDRTGKGLIPLRESDDLLFLSGHGCDYEGKLGQDLTVEEGYEAARQVGINLLATLKDHLGDLDRVDCIVKVLGFVACVPDFTQQPAVMHGFSDLMTEVFGARGQHARSAIGTNALPGNLPVEIEMIVKVRS